MLPNGLLYFSLSHQNPAYIYDLSQTPRPSHPSWLDHQPDNIWWRHKSPPHIMAEPQGIVPALLTTWRLRSRILFTPRFMKIRQKFLRRGKRAERTRKASLVTKHEHNMPNIVCKSAARIRDTARNTANTRLPLQLRYCKSQREYKQPQGVALCRITIN